MTRGGEPVVLDALGLVLEPLKFMEYLLEGATQGALLSRDGVCLVNLPDPARFAVHKLLVSAERRGVTLRDANDNLSPPLVVPLGNWPRASVPREPVVPANSLSRARYSVHAKLSVTVLLAGFGCPVTVVVTTRSPQISPVG